MNELLPCPFCGGEASIHHGDSTDGYIKGTDYVLAFCGWCGASIREKREVDVIRKWNTRPNPWHTGTPTEEGKYIVILRGTYYDIEYEEACSFEWLKDYYDFPNRDDHKAFEVVAWMKHEPYKENKDGRTD